MRNRPGMGGRGIMGNGGNGFGQGMGATPPLLHHQAMMGQGFDPAFATPMGRMAGYGGFPGVQLLLFRDFVFVPAVGGVGLPGVAPHVNPAFFGRGMPMNGMGMMPTTGVEGHNMGMWSDPNMAGWAGEEHTGRAGESSYAEEAVSDHQYGEVSHDRGPWPNAMKEKDRGSERDWSGSSDRRYREDRDSTYERDMPREKDTSQDQDWSERRHRDDRDRERDRGQSRDPVNVPEIGTEKYLESVIGIVIAIGIDIGMRETDMWIIIGIGTVNQNTMMSGKGDGHQGHIASRGCRKRRSNVQDHGMLTMERGDVWPQNN